MSFTINIDLSDRDLDHFRAAQRKAVESAANSSEEEIMAAAIHLLEEAKAIEVPDFISKRLCQLDDLIAMLRDDGWGLTGEDRKRVIAALVYFADPADIIPDSVPVLGFLDDAIMIEICVRELRHEIDAYEDFCEFRQREADQRGLDPSSIGRAEFLEPAREVLLNRMHQRREREMGTGYGGSSGWAQSKSYLGAAWRPGYYSRR
ncbi:MAG: YkvA family protein [Lysobacteraceae bacterium]|jgi:uncharacterized membrane protein YkvA (DUF1232 family)